MSKVTISNKNMDVKELNALLDDELKITLNDEEIIVPKATLLAKNGEAIIYEVSYSSVTIKNKSSRDITISIKNNEISIIDKT